MAKLRGILIAILAAGLLVGPAPARSAMAAETRGSVQLAIDGRVVASFTEVSGLGMESSVIEAVCRVDGKDDDCDGRATEEWQAAVLTALWKLQAGADELERNLWASSRTSHDTAKNAIGNIRARIAQLENVLQDSAQSLKTRHDTVKNAIGNIRAAVRALSLVMTDQGGADRTELKAMQAAAAALKDLADGYRLRYRPGRPVYGNITLRGSVGAFGDASLLQWLRDGAGRKSGSIIFLDAGGKEAARYNFFEAWPVRFSANHLVEEIEFAVERVERTK